MTDQTIPADVTPEDMEHARSYVQDFLDATYAPDRTLAVARVLQALLPTPPLPTLADMTPEEQAACKRMQADVKGYENRAVIVQPYLTGGSARVMWETLRVEAVSWANITPRPDLPLLTWPGGQKPAPAPITPKVCPPRDQLALGAKWYDIAKLEEALRQKGEAADQAIVLDDEGDVHVWETAGGGGWMVRIPVQQCSPFRVILNEKEADQ